MTKASRPRQRALFSIFGLVLLVFNSSNAAWADTVGVDYLLSKKIALIPQSDPSNGSSGKANSGPAVRPPVKIATSEAQANTLALPSSILRTGTDLHSPTPSQNAMQLAEQLGLVPFLQKLPGASPTSVADRLALLETRDAVSQKLRRAEFEVNFTLAELYDEQSLYNEMLGSFSAERDKTVAITNAISFGTNGVLWAIGEAFDIPTYRYPRLSIPSGTISILAGIVPSIASALTLKEVYGKKHSAPATPNMLAKLFDRPTSSEVDYPESVWAFLNSVPATGGVDGKRRRDVIIDRWVADKNIPAFTDRYSTRQIDTITASAVQNKTLTMAVLSTRITLLQQLSAEIFKMNRLLLEIEMIVDGSKHI